MSEEAGWDVHTPDLIHHGADKAQGDKLVGGEPQAVHAAVRCPVLCVRGSDDGVISAGTAKATAAAYRGAAYWQLPGHGHMLLVEPGAEAIARRLARRAARYS